MSITYGRTAVGLVSMCVSFNVQHCSNTPILLDVAFFASDYQAFFCELMSDTRSVESVFTHSEYNYSSSRSFNRGSSNDRHKSVALN